VYLLHRANGAGLDQFHNAPVIVSGVNLSPHLGRNLGFHSSLSDDACLPDVMCQRLLAIHVFAQVQSRQRGEGVRVLRRAYDNRVKFTGMVVELPEVTAAASVWMIHSSMVNRWLKHIAERHNVFGGDSPQIVRASASHADHGDIQFLIQVPAAHDCWDGQCTDSQARYSLSNLAPRQPSGWG
jgi:hypothetical protein